MTRTTLDPGGRVAIYCGTLTQQALGVRATHEALGGGGDKAAPLTSYVIYPQRANVET